MHTCKSLKFIGWGRLLKLLSSLRLALLVGCGMDLVPDIGIVVGLLGSCDENIRVRVRVRGWKLGSACFIRIVLCSDRDDSALEGGQRPRDLEEDVGVFYRYCKYHG